MIDPLSGVGFLLALREIAIGLVMGFIMQMVFSAVVVAGETLAMSMGLGFAMTVDPQNGVQVPVVSQLNVILGTLLYLAIDGHLLLLAALADSFGVIPIDAGGLDARTFSNLVGLGGQIFASALLLALPALTAVLMVNIAFGVITRAAPQLNIFAVGFPVTILVGIVFLMLALPSFLSVNAAIHRARSAADPAGAGVAGRRWQKSRQARSAPNSRPSGASWRPGARARCRARSELNTMLSLLALALSLLFLGGGLVERFLALAQHGFTFGRTRWHSTPSSCRCI